MSAKPIGVESGRFAALLAAFVWLGLAGCGGGLQPPPPTPSLSQTISIEGANATYVATLTNTNQATRRMTYNGNQFGNDTTITQPNYSEDLGCLNVGDYSFSLSATGVTTHTLNKTISQINPTADFSSLNKDMNDKYDEKIYSLEGLVTDPNCEDTANVIGATSLDGKTTVKVNGNELIVRGVAGSSGTYQIEVEYGSQDGGISKSFLEGNMTEVPWQVAFWNNKDQGTGEIYKGNIINGSISNIERLTNNLNQDLQPDFSPDGKYIVFSSTMKDVDGDGLRDIALHIMNTDGSNSYLVSPNLRLAWSPIWCNNNKIFFNYRDSNTNTQGIASINPDSTGFKKITEELFNSNLSGRPACSPDGSLVAHVGFEDGNPEIYTVNSVDGSGSQRITNNLAADFQPMWSPDGKMIIFISDIDGGFDMYSSDPNGANQRKILVDSGTEVDPAFSSDGNKILFAHDLPSFFNPRVNIMNVDGTGRRELIPFTSRYPAWRPWK